MRRTSGFTLIELIVVIGLLGVVTTLGVRTYGAMSGHWNDAKATIAMHDAAGRALESIRRDLHNTAPASFTGQGVLGEPGTRQDPDLFWGVALTDDSIVIPVPDPDDPGRLLLVRYLIERAWHTPRLVRAASYDGLNSRVAVAEGVVSLAVRYREDATGPWLATWNHDRIPAQVSLNIVVMDSRNPARQLARREVVTLHAR